jgi:hypothetical protein
MKTAKIEVLYTSSAILLRLKTIFASPHADDRRVAIVAYVGDGAPAFLASPAGLRVICNPSAGGTSARALRYLIKAGAHIEFSRHLHSKVYWSKKRGCIIGSANASTNALGIGGLKESAVFLPPGMVDIDKLIAVTAPEEVTEKSLAKLQKEIKSLPPKLQSSSEPSPRQKTDIVDFFAWYKSAYRNTDSWKLGWWQAGNLSAAKSAIHKAKREYEVTEPFDFMNVAQKTVSKHDWLLSFEIDGERIRHIKWLFVDFVVPVAASDKGAYEEDFPFQAVQVNGLSKCPVPPFRITPAFRSSFQRAIVDCGMEKIMGRHSLSPPTRLLDIASVRAK